MSYTLEWKDRFTRVQYPAQATIDPLLCEGSFYQLATGINNLKLQVTSQQFTKLWSAALAGAELLFPEQYADIVMLLLQASSCPIEADELEPEMGECPSYLPSAGFVFFEPQNPYNQPNLVPESYVQPPFHLNSDFVWPELFGFLATDVMVSVDSLPIFAGWGDLLSLNFPTIRIHVQGTGQIELNLIAVELGGYACIKVGSPPNILDLADGIVETGAKLVDLNQDSLSIPPESDMIVEDEIEIDAPDGTDVYIVFVPKIDDSISFYGFGGGIRNFQLCGLDGGISGGSIVEDVRFNTETCTFEKRVLGVWTAIENGDEWLACVEALMATQAEIKQAIIDAQEEIAARFLSGQAGNVASGITIGADGSIEVSTDGVPVDDPATTAIDEEEAAFMGGAVSLARGFELVLDKLDTYYGATNGTPTTSEQNAQFGIETYFPCDDAAMDIAVTNYYSYRATNNRILFNTSATFERYLYCFGANAQGISRWLVDQSGYDATKLSIVVRILNALLPEFFTGYYDAGVLVPSTDYIQAPCHKNDVEEWVQDWSTADSFAYGFTQAWKDKHRFLIEIEGTFQDTDEPNVIHDGLWKVNTSTGVKTFVGFVLNVVGTVNVTALQAPYQASHKYAVTVEKTGDHQGTWSINNDTANLPNVTGSTTFRFTDLGLII